MLIPNRSFIDSVQLRPIQYNYGQFVFDVHTTMQSPQPYMYNDSTFEETQCQKMLLNSFWQKKDFFHLNPC